MPLSSPADQDPLSENAAQFVKIDQRVLATEALNPIVVLSPLRQGSIVHHLTKAAHRKQVTHLLEVIGW